MLLLCVHQSAASAQRVACIGDCAIDGRVTVDEIITGVSIALGQIEIDSCALLDRNRDGAVTVDEILAAVTAALAGCTPNQAPSAENPPDYLTYPEQPIRVVLSATDPDDDPLEFSADELPPGASLDRMSGVLEWQPTEADVGSHLVSYTVTDTGLPPLSTSATIRFDVMRLKACEDLECDPATGCTAMRLDIREDCCPAPPDVRDSEPLLDCPEGARLVLGRNAEGFGPLQDCDVVPLVSQAQGRTTLRLHLAPRCIRTTVSSSMRLQVYTANTVLVNVTETTVSFGPADNGFVVQRNRTFGVDDSEIEPERFEGDEAEVSLTVQDADGLFLQKKIRVRLTLQRAGDLPDINSPSEPEP